jgi:YHS domain-containing protein
MRILLLLAVVFATLLVFNTNSYSQCSGETAEKKSCCTEKNSSSGKAQVQPTDSAITLAICPVSKEEFAQGKGKKIFYLGKEYELCCEGCIAEFKAESIGYTGGKAICPICNEDDGKAEITMMHEGIKYYFCAESCKTKFSKDPEKVLKEYNK